MPIEMVSPVARLTSNMPERAPLCDPRAGSALSLNSLMALSRSVFLNLDLTTPAFMAHLRENESDSVLRCSGPRVVDQSVRHVRPPAIGMPTDVSILRLSLGSESRPRRRVGNESSPGFLEPFTGQLGDRIWRSEGDGG